MFFKTLEIHGFKSFADKTILSFDRKMTAVIGSNGNGKSNISDALRWVMGEQGVKTLRGDKMEDVIFHGTKSRGPMGYAKVALSLDNTDRALPVDNDEVIIARRLYRTGESDYLINGERARLKDVHELLMGTGLGRDGYSIIGQGRIADIVSSKDKERREMFEEAAGVSKFLHRKAEAERDLSRAGDNILRLEDIRQELEDRLPVLEKQAEKAIKARDLLETEKQTEISVVIAELKKLEEDIIANDNAILQNTGECEQFDREISELEAEAERLSKEKMELSARLDYLRRQGDGKKTEMAELEKKNAVLENDLRHNDERQAALAKQKEQSKESAALVERRIAEADIQIAGFTKQLAETESAAALKNTELTLSGEKYASADQRGRALLSGMTKLQAERTDALVKRAQFENQQAELEAQVKRITLGASERLEQIAALESKKRDIEKENAAVLTEISALENKQAGYARLLQTRRERLSEAERKLSDLRSDVEKKKARYDVMRGVEQNMEGFTHSVKAVLTAAKQNRLGEVFGTVADIISVPKDYAVAVETALGGAIQDIIVGGEEVAKRCILFLKETNSGRATFLPLTSVKGSELDTRGLENEDGFLGLANRLISYDARFDGVVRSILGRVAVVDDIDTATVIGRKYGYKFRIVTLDGQVVNAGGSFTGGSQKQGVGIISRKQMLADLTVELQTLTDSLELSRGTFSQLSTEVQKLTLESEGFREQLAAVHNRQTRLFAEARGTEDLLSQTANQNADNEKQLADLAARIARVQSGNERLSAEFANIEANITALRTAQSSHDEQLQSAAAQREDIAAKLSELRLSALSLEKDIAAAKESKTVIIENQKSLQTSAEDIDKEIALLSEKSREISRNIQENIAKTANFSGELDGNQKDVLDTVARISKADTRLSEANKLLREKAAERERFGGVLALAREHGAGMEKRVTGIISETLWDKYHMTRTEAAAAATDVANPAQMRDFRQNLLDIRQKINALGNNINYAAVEELQELKARYGALKNQLADIEKSKAELEALILQLTDEIRVTFLENFNTINRYFGKVFAEIFDGGEARLELSDPENVLESGIEIYAAPPGKLIKNLASLSGGEQALIAITIFFAILQHKPTPFCMLDEVDAALDEVNIAKYIRYLKQFAGGTQLMMITHRRGTIEGCDVLYGVFMQEKGVSRLIRQDLSEADEIMDN